MGLGTVGQRKLATLLESRPAQVLVLDIADSAELGAEARRLLSTPFVRYERRRLEPEDLEGCSLVFACTASAQENARIAALCRQAGVFCNTATNPELGTLVVPAVARSGQLSAALTTGGASPLLAALWRRELSAWLEPRARIASLFGKLRPLVLRDPVASGQVRSIFEQLLKSDLPERLQAGDIAACRKTGLAILPGSLHCGFCRILQEYEHEPV